jgi:hypothetical protein
MASFTKYTYPLRSGIRETPEFAKKKLADFAVNVGLKCAHDCTYCSTGAMLRTHEAFKKLGRSSFDSGYSVIDPEIPEKVAQDAKGALINNLNNSTCVATECSSSRRGIRDASNVVVPTVHRRL